MTLEEQKKYDAEKASSAQSDAIAGAGIQAGASLLGQLMAQKARREEERRQTEIQVLESQKNSVQGATNQKQSALGGLMDHYGRLK